MYGSIPGNIIGTAYFLIFQIAGFLLINLFLKKEHILSRLILGSAAGSLLLQWCPILFSFLFGFNKTSHLFALLPLIPILYFGIRKGASANDFPQVLPKVKQHKAIMILSSATMLFWLYLLFTHTLVPAADGSMHCGQCTYGDMNMHLGFITSIAVQDKFPPDYSIFPGTRLAYPFLSDSISSSIYVLGASLRFAYILPMIFAFAQIMGTIYIFVYKLFHSKAKAVLAWILYMFNGGLGFLYFINPSDTAQYHISDIFTGFYTTPTNLVGNNVRWVNIIADMFLPQRATLFGYAIAFPCIYLLYQAAFTEKKYQKTYFLTAGFAAAGLPLIHTHSFMAVGLISASWLLLVLYHETKRKTFFSLRFLSIGFLVFMYLISWMLKKELLASEDLLYLTIFLFALIILYGISLLISYCEKNDVKKLLSTWGLYLLCVLVLAAPQLIFWTFGQVSEGGFVRGHFNWGNQFDDYFWFYLKNLGVPLIFIICGLLSPKKKNAELYLPAGIIWFLAELVVFTPNTYDNNKLLYIAYLLLICAISDFIWDLYLKYASFFASKIVSAVILFLCLISGILTLGREAVSDYQIYGPSAVKLAEYVEANTPTNAVLMTNTRHVNEVASLTGRSIMCGTNTFLYFHGINTGERREELRLLYEAPEANRALFEKYNVTYIVISSWERSDYTIDTNWYQNHCDLVFENNDTQLYKLI